MHLWKRITQITKDKKKDIKKKEGRDVPMFIEVEVKDGNILKKRLINIAHIQTVGTYAGETLVYLEGEHYPIVVNNTYD